MSFKEYSDDEVDEMLAVIRAQLSADEREFVRRLVDLAAAWASGLRA